MVLLFSDIWDKTDIVYFATAINSSKAGGKMDKIYIGIIVVLVIIIISLSTYMLIKSGIYKNMINELQTENKSLITRLSSAESYIDIQNLKISEHSKNMEKAEEIYTLKIKSINEKYSALEKKYKNISLLQCNEVLKIIDNNQRRYIYGYTD